MIPVLNSEQFRAADAWTMDHEPISPVDLMERAASRCADRIIHDLRNGSFGEPAQVRCLVLAGMGNNGGDGLVIARQLKGAGIPIRVLRFLYREKPSPDHATALQRAIEAGVEVIDMNAQNFSSLSIDNELVIDCIFGTGLTSPISGWLGDVVQAVNSSGRPIIAVDLPSGLFAEHNTSNDRTRIVRAVRTYTFEAPKLAFFFAENGPFVGEWAVIPIGLDRSYMSSLGSPFAMVEEADMFALMPGRPRFGHKGTFGHALLVAGSSGKMGAAVLATKAALRSGAGLVTTHVPSGGNVIMQSAVPEAMVSQDPDPDRVTGRPIDLDKFDALGLGPGLGTAKETRSVLKLAIQDLRMPMVLDADALNILAEEPTWQAFLPPSTILTPHPGEFDRLTGNRSTSGEERLERARNTARRLGCVIVLKGAWTAICDPLGQVYFAPTGNPGMAKGGTGDALTGLITGLLAQGLRPLDAAILGVYLHGSAGDKAALHLGMDGMTAMDLIERIPEAWSELRNASQEALH